MKQIGKTYYLTKEESKKLLLNDVCPDPAVEKARKKFFEAQNQMDVIVDDKGGICCSNPGIDEEAIAEILSNR